MDIVLSLQERESQLWKRLEAHYEARLQSLREQNDFNQPESITTAIRARIAEIKEFLALGDSPVPERAIADEHSDPGAGYA